MGWLAVIVFVLGSLLFSFEASGFFINYYKIDKWEKVQGNLVNLELSENKNRIRLSYVYEIDGERFSGNKSSVAKTEWCAATDREIFRLENIMKGSNRIVVKYDPKNKTDSVYAFDCGDVWLILFVLFFPFALGLLFLFVLFIKAKKIILSASI